MKLTIDSNVSKKEHPLGNGSKLVLLDVLGMAAIYPVEEQNRNVFLLNPRGEVVWRVAYHEGIDGGDPFVGMTVSGDAKIVGGTWEGWHFEIGPEDGSVKKLGWSK
jgi:hypothetical protein